VSKVELSYELDTGNLIMVNVLRKEAFDKICIRGSMSIPRWKLKAGGWKELDKTKEIVVRCSSYECGASKVVADFLESRGYNVRAYEGGTQEVGKGRPSHGRDCFFTEVSRGEVRQAPAASSAAS